MTDFKNLRLVKNKRVAKDPPRFPKVINVYEGQSKQDFKNSLQLEGDSIEKLMFSFIK